MLILLSCAWLICEALNLATSKTVVFCMLFFHKKMDKLQ